MHANEDPIEAAFHPRNNPLNQMMCFIGCMGEENNTISKEEESN